MCIDTIKLDFDKFKEQTKKDQRGNEHTLQLCVKESDFQEAIDELRLQISKENALPAGADKVDISELGALEKKLMKQISGLQTRLDS